MIGKRLLKLLPVLAFLGFGVFLWNGGFGLLPAEREVWWSLAVVPSDSTAVEVALTEEGGALLKQDRVLLGRPPMRELRQSVIIKAGHYRATLTAERPSAPPFRQEGRVEVQAGDEPVFVDLGK